MANAIRRAHAEQISPPASARTCAAAVLCAGSRALVARCQALGCAPASDRSVIANCMTDPQTQTLEASSGPVVRRKLESRASLGDIGKGTFFSTNLKTLSRSGSPALSGNAVTPSGSAQSPSRNSRFESSSSTPQKPCPSSGEGSISLSVSPCSSVSSSLSPASAPRTPLTLQSQLKIPPQPQHSYSTSLIISLQRRLEREQAKLDEIHRLYSEALAAVKSEYESQDETRKRLGTILENLHSSPRLIDIDESNTTLVKVNSDPLCGVRARSSSDNFKDVELISQELNAVRCIKRGMVAELERLLAQASTAPTSAPGTPLSCPTPDVLRSASPAPVDDDERSAGSSSSAGSRAGSRIGGRVVAPVATLPAILSAPLDFSRAPARAERWLQVQRAATHKGEFFVLRDAQLAEQKSQLVDVVRRLASELKRAEQEEQEEQLTASRHLQALLCFSEHPPQLPDHLQPRQAGLRRRSNSLPSRLPVSAPVQLRSSGTIASQPLSQSNSNTPLGTLEAPPPSLPLRTSLSKLIVPTQGFHVENSVDDCRTPRVPSVSTRQDESRYHQWYLTRFMGKPHFHILGWEKSDSGERMPFAVSILHEPAAQARVVLRRPLSTIECLVPASGLSRPRRVTRSERVVRPSDAEVHVLRAAGVHPLPEQLCRLPHNEWRLTKELLAMEGLTEQHINEVKQFKMGVVYCAAGQTVDDEMLSNISGSAAFDDFLSLLGDHVSLAGWPRYAAGLDISGENHHGSESVYAKRPNGDEIMFHVSTLLPHVPTDSQQIRRKQHIGNDVGVIVFQDEATPFQPSNFHSQVCHVFAVVSLEQPRSASSPALYRLAFAAKGIQKFGAKLPDPPVFSADAHFAEFLLNKMIAGIKESIRSPFFAQRLRRARENTLKMLLEQFT